MLELQHHRTCGAFVRSLCDADFWNATLLPNICSSSTFWISVLVWVAVWVVIYGREVRNKSLIGNNDCAPSRLLAATLPSPAPRLAQASVTALLKSEWADALPEPDNSVGNIHAAAGSFVSAIASNRRHDTTAVAYNIIDDRESMHRKLDASDCKRTEEAKETKS